MADPANQPPTDYVDQQIGFLRQLLTERIDAAIKRIEERITAEAARASARMDAAERAVATAVSAMDRRLENMNEFREENEGLTATFAPIARVERDEQENKAQFRRIEDSLTTKMPREASDARYNALSDRVGKLETTASQQSGRASGVQWVVGLIQFLVMVAGFALTWFALKPRP